MTTARAWPLAAFLLVACRRGPDLVYVPAGPPAVALRVSASATEVAVGESVILNAARRSSGAWIATAKDAVPEGGCWLASPPPAAEEEVADNVRWAADPAGPARFNVGSREDHTREVTFLAPGTYLLTSSSAIWCAGEEARGAPLRIVVRPPAP